MTTLREYFTYRSKDDGLDISSMFSSLSETLKNDLEDNKLPIINSDTIDKDTNEFTSFMELAPGKPASNYKRECIFTLTKLMVGCYLSASAEADIGFVDCSNIDIDINKFEGIITEPKLKEYVEGTLKGDDLGFYCDFSDRKDNIIEMSGRASSMGRVLSNGYEGACGFDYTNEKTGHVAPIFFPLLIGLSLAAVFSIYYIFSYL